MPSFVAVDGILMDYEFPLALPSSKPSSGSLVQPRAAHTSRPPSTGRGHSSCGCKASCKCSGHGRGPPPMDPPRPPLIPQLMLFVIDVIPQSQ